MTQAIIDLSAKVKLEEVEMLVSNLAAAEGQLEAGYAKLAFLLQDVHEKRYWMGTYESFGGFLSHLSERFNLKKSQLYNYLSAARELGGTVTESQLNQMGISKALALREAKLASGSVPENVLTAALDPKVTVKDVKRMLFEAAVVQKPEDGRWFDLDFSCYLTPEEHQEIMDAANAARHIDPPISETLKDFMQRKEILLRFAREFLAANAEAVIDGGQGI